MNSWKGCADMLAELKKGYSKALQHSNEISHMNDLQSYSDGSAVTKENFLPFMKRVVIDNRGLQCVFSEGQGRSQDPKGMSLGDSNRRREGGRIHNPLKAPALNLLHKRLPIPRVPRQIPAQVLHASVLGSPCRFPILRVPKDVCRAAEPSIPALCHHERERTKVDRESDCCLPLPRNAKAYASYLPNLLLVYYRFTSCPFSQATTQNPIPEN